MGNMKKTKIKLIMVALSILFLLTIFSTTLSYACFETPNFLHSFQAYVKISTQKELYQKIQSEPQIILAKSESKDQEIFQNFLKKENYIFVEQIGSEFIILKDGMKEHVVVSSNSYYSLWVWT